MPNELIDQIGTLIYGRAYSRNMMGDEMAISGQSLNRWAKQKELTSEQITRLKQFMALKLFEKEQAAKDIKDLINSL